MARKRNANDTVPMAQLTAVTLDGVVRRHQVTSSPEPTLSMQISMHRRMRRALDRIMRRLEFERLVGTDPQ
ncbi:MAG: hypothetical protein JKY37_13645 [Nannocystaceae bacterium]|nr:hypothetical protein [Nannocystaceae bacterium]